MEINNSSTKTNTMNALKGKVAYITGGSKGIGYGIAEKLLAEGMRVAITSRHADAAREAARSLNSDPENILALESDVTSMASEKAAVQAVIDQPTLPVFFTASKPAWMH
jgi:3-oxoacyl-[acyl-carrier protein] reductase